MGFYEKSFETIKQNKLKSGKIIKDSSILDYLRNIKKISKELFDVDKPAVNYFADYDSVAEYMDGIANPFSRKMMCTSIIVLIESSKIKKVVKDKYRDYQKKLAVFNDGIYRENEKSSKEETNWISREEIQEVIDNTLLRARDPKQGSNRQQVDYFQQYLVLNLYFQLPPIRNDYANVKIIDKEIKDTPLCSIDTEFNYVNFFDNTLYLCVYKTAKFYGTQKIPIPENLMSIIKEYESLKKEKLNYTGPFMLINTTNLTKMNGNTLTKYLNKIFKPKKVSTTILRKVYLSEKYPISHSLREMELDAKCMGHDILTARKIYTKKLN
jgi:hypothetical protein